MAFLSSNISKFKTKSKLRKFMTTLENEHFVKNSVGDVDW